MNEFQVTGCPLCANSHLTYLFVSHGYPVSKCQECGLMFLNPQPSDQNLAAIPEAGSGAGMDKAAIDAHLKALARYHGASSGRLCFLGAGKDSFVEAAQKMGFDASPGDGPYDLCVLYQALERSRNPVTELERIRGLLKPGGTLYLITSKMEFKTESLFYFDSQTLQGALAKSGFRELELDQEVGVPLFGSGMNTLARAFQPRERPLLSIIVPVYNEARTFPQLMKLLLDKDIPGADKEILLVESNSSDGTRDEVLKFQGAPGVKILLEERPRGKGHAVRTGLKAASGDIVMIQDGDLEYDINDYDQLLEPLLAYQCAVVLGSRHSGSWKIREFTGQPVLSMILNAAHSFFAFLLNAACGSKLKDPFTMYKLFRRDCVHGLTFKANRFDFDWELMIKLLRKGYVPREIPVNYRSRSFGEGKKVSLFRDPITWIWALVRFRLSPLYKKDLEP